MSTELRLIEVKRVLSNDDKENYTTEKETIDVNLIRSFRIWHKGPKDTKIDGDMVIIVLKPDNQNVIKPRTMLIQESYESFSNRIGYKVPLNKA